MAKYEQYAEYKDSGVEWLGEIPSSWKTGSLRWMIDIASGESLPSNCEKEYSKENQFPVVGGNGIMGFSNKVNTADAAIAVGRVGALCGNIHSIDYDSWITDNALKISKWKNFSKGFLVYLLKTANLNDLASKTAQPLITGEQVKSLKVVFLSIDEQTQIANFLDFETAQIDTLIEKQQTLIKLLKEKRQAVISHAVTKGLNPDAPMKDSGVEWLGEVPEHWEVGRLKNVLRIRNGKDYKAVEVESGGYPVYGSGGIFKRSSDYLFDGESVLFGRKGTIDKPLLVSGRFWTVDTMFYSEVSNNAKPDYIYHQALLFPFDKLSTNTALPSMTQEDLLNLGFVIPPFDEQEEICQYLYNKLKVFSNLVSKAEQAIQLMQERRTALISAAVTGKIDVRGWVAPDNNIF